MQWWHLYQCRRLRKRGLQLARLADQKQLNHAQDRSTRRALMRITEQYGTHYRQLSASNQARQLTWELRQ